MYLWISRLTLLIVSILTSSLLAEPASAKTGIDYLGTSTDDRVQRCGITLSGDEIVWIEPFLDSDSDIEGRLELEVTERNPSGKSQSRHASNFVGGRLGTTIIAMNRPDEVAVMLSVTDRSGKTLCAMRRSIMLGSVPLKI
ncbi:hypothetical protein E2F50_22355 [Rhizobium deserti]|uniref:Uncharacterized protein n=1 Tax=Rhizobium deserti TaxID=2547961 RepID=A0A4R5U771_9HYPH|nr:curli-like amyloid fiber formation chaperone CsgH [Rhizobium deserti]TDK29683.1 hypothetical protein E2F50_22355 [Rhizobium deserti]